MYVPLLDLRAQYTKLRDKIKKALDEVLETQQFILGPKVAALEEALAAYCGVDYAVGVSSGTDAILVALMACGIGEGDEVITSPYTFFATVGSIVRLKAKPVFVDITPQTFNLNVDQIEAKINSKTKAIIPVHLFGQSAEMASINDIAQRHNLVVIEDAAQALGATYKGRKVGAWGDMACFSFFPSKNLGGYGDGGMVITNKKEIYERVKMLRVHGAKDKYKHEMIGGNFRLDEIQAAILLVKLPYLDEWNKQRAKHADIYFSLFKQAGLLNEIKPPVVDSANTHIFHQYIIRASRRDALLSYLTKHGVGCAVYYPIPLHLQPCFRYLGYQEGDFPEAEKAAKETIALPIYPELTLIQQEYVVEKIKKFYANG
ncbi:MAG: DegT/DnrJ/EryC1/StrS family aminotransferase [Candidatus Desulfofervidaceae bacterium]|nr:DegT/DnrJ/EryC1/StrS family aminotransferase [Candidatus Desulfofervidaceae bacterium]